MRPPKDFAQTLALVNEVGFAQAYAFKYSPRAGTPAAGLAEQVPEAVKEERLAGLLQVLAAQQEAFNYASQGTSAGSFADRAGQTARAMQRA